MGNVVLQYACISYGNILNIYQIHLPNILQQNNILRDLNGTLIYKTVVAGYIILFTKIGRQKLNFFSVENNISWLQPKCV